MPFEAGDYVVKVILLARGTPQEVTSPGLSQSEAEAALSSIDEARRTGDNVKLDWLTTYGNLVVSAHIQDRR